MPEPSQNGSPHPLPERVLYRQRFTVEVVWSQPAEQAYEDDWGAVIGAALSADDPSLWDLAAAPVELLSAEAVPD